MQKIVGIGEYAVSNKQADIIKTYALASCVAVTAYNPVLKVGGMVHVALPSPGSQDEGKSRPGYYAATGVPLLIDKLCRISGCKKGEFKIQIFGGADSINCNDVFTVGRKNIAAVTKALSGLNINIYKAEVGGTQSRTIEMDLLTGNIKVYRQPIRI